MAEPCLQHLRVDEPTPLFGDFEASGPDRDSYPIEIAWSLPGGAIKSRLIRREPGWENWDEISEELHGISLIDLEHEGHPVREVAAEMNRDLSGKVLHFDGGGFDRFWLAKLYDAAWMQPSFGFGDFERILAPICPTGERERMISEAKAEVLLRLPCLHRAGDDVRFMQELYGHLKASAYAGPKWTACW